MFMYYRIVGSKWPMKIRWEPPMNLGLVVADRCIFFFGGGVIYFSWEVQKMMMFCMGKNKFVKISVIVVKMCMKKIGMSFVDVFVA